MPVGRPKYEILLGRGMLPTIPEWRTLLGVEDVEPKSLERGMVVTFTRDIMKNGRKKATLFEVLRIVGLPGERFLNDRQNREELIPENCVYVVGDNRTEAVDSGLQRLRTRGNCKIRASRDALL
ncbi:hypothetical protein L596_007139 [Steinernema carpocapsae]|nr:hypothetical protein L596_007139 [Steinernema carpocapsae]